MPILSALRSRSPTRTQPFCTSRARLNDHDGDKKASLLDRESVNTESNEYSKSGSDQGSAADDTAFQTGKTDPESERASSQPGKNGRDPLDASPANMEISQPTNPAEGGVGSGSERKQASGGGEASKSRTTG